MNEVTIGKGCDDGTRDVCSQKPQLSMSSPIETKIMKRDCCSLAMDGERLDARPHPKRINQRLG